jgi:DNA-binding GntR family transcriptional regulator
MSSSSAEERISDIAAHRLVAARIAARDPEGARLAMMQVLGTLPDNVRRVVASGDAAGRS